MTGFGLYMAILLADALAPAACPHLRGDPGHRARRRDHARRPGLRPRAARAARPLHGLDGVAPPAGRLPPRVDRRREGDGDGGGDRGDAHRRGHHHRAGPAGRRSCCSWRRRSSAASSPGGSTEASTAPPSRTWASAWAPRRRPRGRCPRRVRSCGSSSSSPSSCSSTASATSVPRPDARRRRMGRPDGAFLGADRGLGDGPTRTLGALIWVRRSCCSWPAWPASSRRSRGGSG